MHMLAAIAALLIAAPSAPDAPAKPVKEKKICRAAGPITGSRLGGVKRDCKTQAQWDAENKDASSVDLDRLTLSH